MALLTDVEGVSFVNKEPKRDAYVGVNYRLRVKRHHCEWLRKYIPYASST